MQTAVQYSAPSLLPYAHPTLSLNRGVNSNSNAMPTPPVPTRKRKRPHQYSVSYSEVQEVDTSGRLREVIVIEDTPPPPSTVSPATTHNHLYSASYQPPVYSAPVRTRARAAAEAQVLSTSSSSAVAPPPPKKRKRDPVDVAGTVAKRSAANGHPPNISSSNKSWASGSGITVDDVRPCLRYCASRGVSCTRFEQASNGSEPCDDKEGHYIIRPNDMIFRRCKHSVRS